VESPFSQRLLPGCRTRRAANDGDDSPSARIEKIRMRDAVFMGLSLKRPVLHFDRPMI
jgi:hypothetical protein